MNRVFRAGAVGAVLIFILFAGWRIVGEMQAERYGEAEPERTLAWRPNDPKALLALAEQLLAQREFAASQLSARRLLAHEPLKGEAFRVLAQIAEHQGDGAEAFRLYRIAGRRAPRDLPTRVWLTQRFLEVGKYDFALAQIDRILRMSPNRARSIYPVLVKMAQDEAFANALAHALRSEPPWRPGMLEALRTSNTVNSPAAGLVMGALQRQGGLSPKEYAGWLDSLISDGRWAEAYARWAGGVPKSNGRLPLVYNGDSGFDWRLRRIPGVLLQFEQAAGSPGRAAYLHFLDRRIPGAGLEQALLLSPGLYRLSLGVKAQGMQSALGLQWVIACAGPGGVVARTAPIDGTFGWRGFDTNFAIPDSGCPGQWLQLINPVPAGSAQLVAGDLWISHVKIFPQK
jgi:cytochrome c-type biogenesis protein CcmH/NrfG